MSATGTAGVPAGARTVPPAPPGATRLVLVRHGEATCNVEGIVGGPLGCTGLSPTGVAQAEALRDRLLASGALGGATALYSSILPRAVHTATIVRPAVGDGTLEVVSDCGLCELHPGAGDGLRWPEFVERYGEPDWDSDPDTELAPGGESWRGFVQRAAAALEALASRHPGEQVVVVCHAGVIESAMLRLLPMAGTVRLRLRTEHTSVTEFEADDRSGGWRLLRYNDAGHLSG